MTLLEWEDPGSSCDEAGRGRDIRLDIRAPNESRKISTGQRGG